MTESVNGIYLKDLHQGSVLDVETKSRHYRIEYVGGDEILVSGHPVLCPDPVPAHLWGSLGKAGVVQPGFVGEGMRLEFQRVNDRVPVITSAIEHVHEVHN